MSLTAPEPISTERLTIRLIEPGDLPALLAVNGDPTVTRHLPYATWAAMADALAWYQRMLGIMETGTALQFVIVRRSDDLPIGTALVFRHDEGSQRAELGYALGSAFWGQGYMQEALQALVQAAFGPVMGLRRLEAEVNPANTASVQVLERLGFQREGLLRQRWTSAKDEGRPYDVAVYGLLREDGEAPK
jgi:[ribosomal protein S5]-alanine N-acetyltransferase